VKVTMTNTPGIMFLAKNAAGRNRCIDEDEFVKAVDSGGKHILVQSFPHNDVELRTHWLCKMRETDQPEAIWLDVDFDAFKMCTTVLEVPDEE